MKNRSVEAWGPLAKLTDTEFDRIINNCKGNTKYLVKQQKKLKAYNVTFTKEWKSDQYEIMAENEYDVSSKARQFFKDNADTIGFKETPRGKWADDYAGYDRIYYD